MPEHKKTQYSLAGGEIGPESLGRGDIERWQSSAEVMRNWQPLAQGGGQNRSGTKYFGYERIDFGDRTSNSGSVAAGGNPAIVTDSSHGRATGEVVTVTYDATSPHDMSGAISSIEVIDANTFYMVNVDASAFAGAHTITYYMMEPSDKVVCIPFTFNADDTYALYLSDRWMMVARNGEMVLETAGAQTATEYSYTSTGINLRLRVAALTLIGDGAWWSGDEVFVGSELDTALAKDHGAKRYTILLTNHPSISETINDVTNANPAVVSVTSHPYVNGQIVSLGINSGMPEINNREYKVRNSTSTTFEIEDIHGDLIDSTGYGTFSSTSLSHPKSPIYFFLMGSGGNSNDSDTGLTIPVNRYFRMITPWAASDLANLDYSQTHDTITITCPGFEPRSITRTAHDVWTIAVANFIPGIEPPASLSSTPGPGTNNRVKVTSVAQGTAEESLAIEGWLLTDPTNELTWPTVDGAFEYNIYMSRLGDPTAGLVSIATSGKVLLNTTILGGNATDDVGQVDVFNRSPELTNPFQVRGTGNVIEGIVTATGVLTLATDPHNLVPGDHVEIVNCIDLTDLNGRKFIVDTTPLSDTLTLKYIDEKGSGVYDASTGTLYPLTTSDTPTAIAYHQQRLVLANTPLHPQAIYMTKSAVYTSMGTSTPLLDTDAISLEIVDTQANAIKWLVPMQQLVALTEGGIFAIVGNSAGVLTPTAHTPVAQYGVGVGDVKPVKFGEAIIFVTAEGDKVFELLASSDFNSAKSYIPGDISVLANHLFKGKTITSMAAQFSPVPVIWSTRSDGILLGLTYIREHEVFAWHRHDTFGDFESVATIPEGRVTGSYFVVKRTLGMVTKRYFERLDNRDFEDIQDAFFVDCGVQQDEPFTASVLFGDRATATFTIASGHTFVDDDQFDIEHKIRTAQGIVAGLLDGVRYIVDNKTATTVDGVTLLDGSVVDITTKLSGVDTRTLTLHRCTKTMTGLDHLIGHTVAVLADGAHKPDQVVSASGTLTFTDFHSRITAGLPIEADILTLPADAVAGPYQSLHGVPLKTQRASMVVHNTIGLKVGPDFDSLTEVKWRDSEPYGIATQPFTGQRHLKIDKKWGRGQLAIRQNAPLPATILTINTELEGDK